MNRRQEAVLKHLDIDTIRMDNLRIARYIEALENATTSYTLWFKAEKSKKNDTIDPKFVEMQITVARSSFCMFAQVACEQVIRLDTDSKDIYLRDFDKMDKVAALRNYISHSYGSVKDGYLHSFMNKWSKALTPLLMEMKKDYTTILRELE